MPVRKLALALCIAGAALASPGHAGTLFADLGEKPGLERIVDTMVTISAADPRIADKFEDTNLTRLKGMIVAHLCHLTGGGCTYTGGNMRTVHKGLHLEMRHFNAVVENLQTAMDRSNVPFSAQNRLLAILAPMQRDVVSR
jgi:hemoglobin